MKIKTSELTGAALDWAVAKCEGHKWRNAPVSAQYTPAGTECWRPWHPSTHHSQGGPIIDREKLDTAWDKLWCQWYSPDKRNAALAFVGATPLIAAMRCYVASKLGEEVDVPEELA